MSLYCKTVEVSFYGEKLYNTLIKKYKFIQIEIEIEENKQQEKASKIDENAKNEIMSKIIEDTKKRIKMKNEEIISESKVIEPQVTNEFENIIKNKLNALSQEIIKDSQIAVQKIQVKSVKCS